MTGATGKSETHGCIVCGRLYQLLAAYDAHGKYIDSKVMSAGGKVVQGAGRPLVACERHSIQEIEKAVAKVYGNQDQDDE